MDLYEYQGKQYFAQFGIPASDGGLAKTVEEAVHVGNRVGYPAIVKAQVRTGGRGKAGGIKLAHNAEDLAIHARNILGMSVKGHVVHNIWVERATEIAAERYVAFMLDRAAKQYVVMASSEGGVDIEQVAQKSLDAVLRLHIDPTIGFTSELARNVAAHIGACEVHLEEMTQVLQKLYRCFNEGDADLVEVNPLVVTKAGGIEVVDAKVSLDDNAEYRHPEWATFREGKYIDPRERLARSYGLNYIGLDGTVGIIGNGAGLVMSTLDVVHEVGGSAANFLDVGGGAGADVLANAIEVVNADAMVRAILINIFGGITRCDDVAEGILTALDRVDVQSPIVVRLDGTNATEGREMLRAHESSRLRSRPTMIEAAQTAVELSKVAQ